MAFSDHVAQPLRAVRILVVEDDEDCRKLWARYLVSAGASVDEAASASAARSLLERRLPHVIVSDIGLPGEDGHSLMRELRQRSPERGGTIPSLAVTAYVGAHDIAEAQRSGFTLYLPKPVLPAEILAAIMRLIAASPSDVTTAAPASGGR